MSTALSTDNTVQFTAAQTSREVKKHLKKAFPTMEKLSVTCKNFSLRIRWINGPSKKAVEQVVRIFEGAQMVQNGGDMIKGYKEAVEFDGRKIDFGIDFIVCERELSPENTKVIVKYVSDEYGYEMPVIDENGRIMTPITWQFQERISKLETETDIADIAGLVWATVETSIDTVAIEAPATVETVEAIEEEVATVEIVDPVQCELCGFHCHPFYSQIINNKIICEECIKKDTETLTSEDTETPTSEIPQETIIEEETIGEQIELPSSVEQMFVAHDADPRSTIEASTYYRFDPVSRIHWLEFDGRPEQEIIDLLKKEGWRWSRYRKQWYTNQRWAQVPKGIEYFNDGECDYSAERAERLEARAEKASARGQASYQRAHEIGSRIPFGQPILVGHHSEKRHRKDIERIDNGMHNWLKESDKARRLEDKAEGSIAHRAYLERPSVIYRRIQRLEADLRGYQRHKKGWENDLEEYNRRVSLLEKEIAENKAKLEEAGGIKSDHVETGDIIQIDGFIGRVEGKPRPNGKTYRITITEGGAKGMELTLDRSRFSKIIKKHTEIA